MLGLPTQPLGGAVEVISWYKTIVIGDRCELMELITMVLPKLHPQIPVLGICSLLQWTFQNANSGDGWRAWPFALGNHHSFIAGLVRHHVFLNELLLPTGFWKASPLPASKPRCFPYLPHSRSIARSPYAEMNKWRCAKKRDWFMGNHQ